MNMTQITKFIDPRKKMSYDHELGVFMRELRGRHSFKSKGCSAEAVSKRQSAWGGSVYRTWLESEKTKLQRKGFYVEIREQNGLIALFRDDPTGKLKKI